MSLQYQAIGWNRQRRIYDSVLEREGVVSCPDSPWMQYDKACEGSF
jgi:hypothetical protein